MKLSALRPLARRQHGVIARRQTDLSASSWHRALARGTLIALHRGVARLVGTADSREQRIIAGVLAAGPGALASHRSAAHLHGIPSMQTAARRRVVPIARRSRRGLARKAPSGSTASLVHRPRDLANDSSRTESTASRAPTSCAR